ncbi:MAG: hypothetical protein KDA73_13360 [Rhodobacteraceae bacterium]|nr:hypothetical protein [Paracoccaceae bacterium]
MRVFKCPSCGHRMRLRGYRCTRCYAEKPIMMTVAPYKLLIFLGLLVLSGTMLIDVLSHIAHHG